MLFKALADVNRLLAERCQGAAVPALGADEELADAGERQ